MMTLDFDFVLSSTPDTDQLKTFLSKPYDWKMQTTFGSGAIVDKSSSSLGLVKIRIWTWDKDNRTKLLELFASAAVDLTSRSIDTSVTYIEGGRYVGWVHYHPKGGKRNDI